MPAGRAGHVAFLKQVDREPVHDVVAGIPLVSARGVRVGEIAWPRGFVAPDERHVIGTGRANPDRHLPVRLHELIGVIAVPPAVELTADAQQHGLLVCGEHIGEIGDARIPLRAVRDFVVDTKQLVAHRGQLRRRRLPGKQREVHERNTAARVHGDKPGGDLRRIPRTHGVRDGNEAQFRRRLAGCGEERHILGVVLRPLAKPVYDATHRGLELNAVAVCELRAAADTGRAYPGRRILVGNGRRGAALSGTRVEQCDEQCHEHERANRRGERAV